MRLRLTIGTTACAIVAGALLLATPAQAAGSSYTTNCDAPLTIIGNVGDEVTITWGSNCYYMWNINGSGSSKTESGFLDWVSSDPAPGSGLFYPFGNWAKDWYQYYEDWTPSQAITVKILGQDGDANPLTNGAVMAAFLDNNSEYSYAIYGGTGEAAGVPIADVIQQVGAPAGGTCDTVDDKSLDWGGVTSGGWTGSWAQWASDGKGGSVCTRTLHYDNGWRIAA